MLVRGYMSQPPIVISPKTLVSDALKMMRERGVRGFAAVDSGGRLIGIVSDKNLSTPNYPRRPASASGRSPTSSILQPFWLAIGACREQGRECPWSADRCS